MGYLGNTFEKTDRKIFAQRDFCKHKNKHNRKAEKEACVVFEARAKSQNPFYSFKG